MGQRIFRVEPRVDFWDLPVFPATLGLRNRSKRGFGTWSPSERRWSVEERRKVGVDLGRSHLRKERTQAWYRPLLTRSATYSQATLTSPTGELHTRLVCPTAARSVSDNILGRKGEYGTEAVRSRDVPYATLFGGPYVSDGTTMANIPSKYLLPPLPLIPVSNDSPSPRRLPFP